MFHGSHWEPFRPFYVAEMKRREEERERGDAGRPAEQPEGHAGRPAEPAERRGEEPAGRPAGRPAERTERGRGSADVRGSAHGRRRSRSTSEYSSELRRITSSDDAGPNSEDTFDQLSP